MDEQDPEDIEEKVYIGVERKVKSKGRKDIVVSAEMYPVALTWILS